MNFYVMTLFPDMVRRCLSESITGRAMAKKLIDLQVLNIRDFTSERHGKVDDYPFGGGAGMLMQVQPIDDCFSAILKMIGKKERPMVFYMSPQGEVFTQKMACKLSKLEDLVFLCGHYEGVDERALEIIGAKEVSLGDFILTGGEYPAMVMIDCISRLIPGVLSEDSNLEESFTENLLEYPQYSRPENYKGMEVPKILLSGHHENIKKWRRKQSILKTLKRRPDLLKNAILDEYDKEFLDSLKDDIYDDI